MEVKIEIKSIFGNVLFEFSKENNTIKDTIIEAVKRGANLRGANLHGADLGDADLHGADLGDADLRGAYLHGANLRGAYLGDANLGGAYLHGAYLHGANLHGANLRDAYLRGANLRGAYLHGADLGDADLGDANLGDAYLHGAYLHGANLRGAYLGDANLGGAYKITSVDDILLIGPIGSRADYTHIYRTDKGVYVKCGCFFGTVDEFASKVKDTHGDNKFANQYRKVIDFVNKYFETDETGTTNIPIPDSPVARAHKARMLHYHTAWQNCQPKPFHLPDSVEEKQNYEAVIWMTLLAALDYFIYDLIDEMEDAGKYRHANKRNINRARDIILKAHNTFYKRIAQVSTVQVSTAQVSTALYSFNNSILYRVVLF